VPYGRLNARQKENHNHAKLAAALADYGFSVMRLSDDWEGADLIAQHVGGRVLRIQLKSRLAIAKKYRGKGLYLAFPHDGKWYLGPHGTIMALWRCSPRRTSGSSSRRSRRTR
jgi:hypothetical protein